MTHMPLIELLCFLAVVVPLIRAGIYLWRSAGLQGYLRVLRVAILLGTAFFLFRPHGNTFTALDHSGTRLMAHAFVSGRAFHEVDQSLLSVPLDIRNALMLLPTMDERNTRDRSFLARSLHRCETEPFFYPLLPLLAAGTQTLLPWGGMDLIVPLLGLFCFSALLLIGASYGRGMGMVMALVFFIGCPLPMMLFRGFYSEAAGSAFLAMAIATWILKSHHRHPWDALVIGWALGLSVGFHPVFVILSVPVLTLFLFDPQTRPRSAISGMAGFATGLLPIILFTEYVCAPYGSFRPSTFIFNFQASASHRLALGFAVISGFVLIAGLISKPWWQPVLEKLSTRRRFWVILLILALAPLVLSGIVWSNHNQVCIGLGDSAAAIRWPMGILISLGVAGLFSHSGHRRAKAMFLVFVATFPVFVYLKGAEQMGMWSQRRLLPAYIMLALALLPWLAEAANRFWNFSLSRPFRRVALLVTLFTAGFSNWIRWPTPYWTREERGALEWVTAIQTNLPAGLIFFDYQPLSFPFAVNNRDRVLGLGEHAGESLPQVMAWLKQETNHGTVTIATAYEPVPLEEGLLLVPTSRKSIVLDRIVGARALPSKTDHSEFSLALLRALPVNDGHRLTQDKILDGGPLGQRGPWGRNMAISIAGGKREPATWSRDGSGVIGPVPPRGEIVKVTLWATSAQNKAQQLTITPPWTTGAITVTVPATYSNVTAVLQVPIGLATPLPPTGIYRFSSPSPYDPARDGIGGFPADLGALIHRVTITPERPNPQ